MSLRKKTLFIIGGLFIVLFLALFGAAQLIVLKSFGKLERNLILLDLDRAQKAIENDLASMHSLVADWANWDDSYAFVLNGDSNFINDNLVRQTFVNLRLNLIAYVRTSGEVVYGDVYDEAVNVLQPLSDSIRTHLKPDAYLITQVQSDTLTSGILMLPDGPMLVAAHAILTSQQYGPSRGTLIFGRYLGSDEIQYFSEITHVVINSYAMADSLLPQDVRVARAHLSGSNPRFFKPLDDETMAGYTVLRDIYGQPALLLRVTVPREVYLQGISTTRLFYVSILGTALIFAVAMLLLLERNVLSRLTNLSSSVAGIASGGDPSARVPVQGKDELANLAVRINEMLAAIENSEAELNRYAEHLEALFQELKISEGKLRSVFDFSPDGIAVIDLEGAFVECNQAILALWGCSDTSEIIGRRIHDFIPERKRQKIIDGINAVLQQGHLTNIEIAAYRRDGSLFPAEISVGLVKDSSGRPSCMVAIARNIAERKRAEQALSMSEQRYRLLFERNLAGVFRTSLDGRILDVNNAMLKMFGFSSREEMMSCRVQDFYEDAAARQSFISKLWERGTVSNHKQKLRRPDGSSFWVLENVSLVIGELAEPVLIQGTMIDITDLIEAEEVQRTSEALSRLLYERNIAGLFSFTLHPQTLEAHALDCNDAHARMLGYSSRNELLKIEPAQTFLSEQDYAHELKYLLEHKTLTNYEVRLRKKDGSPVWVQVNVAYIEGENGGAGIVEGTSIEITELKRAQQREQQARSKLIEQSQVASIGLLAAGLAHNLKGPLQGIISSVEILQLMHGDIPHLDEIMQQAQRLNDMINGILNKTRQEQDGSEQEIDLNQLLIQELDFLNSNMTFKYEIRKEYNFDSNLPPVRGVYCDFSQALTNIIMNAMDAMYGREDKLLSIATKAQEDGGILIEVKDTGCGIAPECLERIFDPFFTTKPMAGAHGSDEPTGSGLGLSSAKQLLEKYNVRFDVESQVGQGTTFRICIPPQESPQIEQVNLPEFELEEETS